MAGHSGLIVCHCYDVFLGMDRGAIILMTYCSAMFPQCMTRVNNPKDCDCPTAFSFRADPDETKGRAISRRQAELEARRSMGRKVELLPQSKLDQIRNVMKTAVFDIVPPVKSKQDQKMARRNISDEVYTAFENLVDIGQAPCEAFDIGWVEGRERLERSTEERFWSIVDRNGPSGLPSDMWEAIAILADKAGI